MIDICVFILQYIFYFNDKSKMAKSFLEMRAMIDQCLDVDEPSENVRKLCSFLMSINPVPETNGPGRRCSSCRMKNSNRTLNCTRCGALFVPKAIRATVAPAARLIGINKCQNCPNEDCSEDHPKGPPVKMIGCEHVYHMQCYKFKKSLGHTKCGGCDQPGVNTHGELPEHC